MRQSSRRPVARLADSYRYNVWTYGRMDVRMDVWTRFRYRRWRNPVVAIVFILVCTWPIMAPGRTWAFWRRPPPRYFVVRKYYFNDAVVSWPAPVRRHPDVSPDPLLHDLLAPTSSSSFLRLYICCMLVLL